MRSQVFIAIDLGAGSGRILAAEIPDDRLVVEEIHRFQTPGVGIGDALHWDMLAVFRNILDGLRVAASKYGQRIVSVGVDCWGVDFGLLDSSGRLLGNPHQYRDSRNAAAMRQRSTMNDRTWMFEETGIQPLPYNTAYQLYAEKLTHTGVLDLARHLLFLPDLISYWLCGERIQERTIASTSQLWNPRTGAWSEPVIDALGLPRNLFHPVISPGTKLGGLLAEVKKQTGLGDVDVVAIGGHDTASAVAGAPLESSREAFMSSGTWSLLGIERSAPLINPAVRDGGYSNEAGVEGTTRLLKNICGMWLIEQLRADWAHGGTNAGYEELITEARQCPAFISLIDPDDPRFASPGDMVAKIQRSCRESGQTIPTTRGALVRCALESLAAKVAISFHALRQFAPNDLQSLRIIGGGGKNAFLNQALSDALGLPVMAGPAEATSLGNLIMQMKAAGAISNVAEGREIIARSFDTDVFTPQEQKPWIEAVDRLQNLIATRPPATT